MFPAVALESSSFLQQVVDEFFARRNVVQIAFFVGFNPLVMYMYGTNKGGNLGVFYGYKNYHLRVGLELAITIPRPMTRLSSGDYLVQSGKGAGGEEAMFHVKLFPIWETMIKIVTCRDCLPNGGDHANPFNKGTVSLPQILGYHVMLYLNVQMYPETDRREP